MIRKATINDMKEIMGIIKETVKEMKDYNNTQWDANYPAEEDFINDIEKEELYVYERENQIAGFICINKIEAKEYNDLSWTLDEEAMIVHRMAVKSSQRKLGIGSSLMKFADDLALENNMKYLKTDTYSINTKMNSLFKKCGYKFIGEVKFIGKEKTFYCYEKLINIK
ncbi:MAG: GNAT family N-acetyltransferase [Peptostreptococcaceae bacterium]